MAGQAKRFSQEIAAGVKRSADVVQQLTLEGLRDKLDAMVPLVRKVMKQTRARILHGDTRGDGADGCIRVVSPHEIEVALGFGWAEIRH